MNPEIFIPDVWTVRPVTLGEVNPIPEPAQYDALYDFCTEVLKEMEEQND